MRALPGRRRNPGPLLLASLGGAVGGITEHVTGRLLRRRRNPESRQLESRLEEELRRLTRYQERGKPKGYARTEAAAERTMEAMAAEPADRPRFFTVRRGGHLVHVPERINLQEADRYDRDVDARAAHDAKERRFYAAVDRAPTTKRQEAARRRRYQRDQRFQDEVNRRAEEDRQEGELTYRKERARELAKARYDPAKAKAARERRAAGIVVISPDWTQKHQKEVYDAAVKAGKSIEYHSRTGREMSLIEVMKQENLRQSNARRQARAARIRRTTSRRLG